MTKMFHIFCALACSHLSVPLVGVGACSTARKSLSSQLPSNVASASQICRKTNYIVFYSDLFHALMPPTQHSFIKILYKSNYCIYSFQSVQVKMKTC